MRQRLSPRCALCTSGWTPASLVLYDVSTLYSETDTGDGFFEPGFSKECAPGVADHDRPTASWSRSPIGVASGGMVLGPLTRASCDALRRSGEAVGW